MLCVLAVAVPTVVAASEGDVTPAQLPPVLDPGERHPTLIGSADGTVREMMESAAGQGGTGSDFQLATIKPTVFWDNIESGVGGWTAGSPWAITTEWQPYSWIPENHSWSDSPGGNYAANAVADLDSQTFDLSTAAPGQDIYLYFDYTSELEDERDYLLVMFSGDNGSNWNYYGDYITGSIGVGYAYVEIPVAVRTSQFKFRLELTTDSVNNYDGVHIDYVSIQAQSTESMQEDDSRLAYLGDWSSGTATTYYSYTWDYKYTSTPGDVLQISFTGPAIYVYGRAGPSCGIAEISLDGGTPYTQDQYIPVSSDPNADTSPCWMAGYSDIADVPHVLTIRCTGTKNPASTGYEIGFDEALVWGTGTTAPGAIRVDEDHSYLEYVGPWEFTPDPAAWDGGLGVVDEYTSSVNFSFTGTYATWNAKKGPGYGKAMVSVDGGPTQTVDLYKSWNSYQKRVYDTGLLSEGPHTLSIYCSGKKNWSAWDTKIDVDSFDVLGTVTDADPAPAMLWRYQQNDPRITYLGDWGTSNTWKASGGSFTSTSQAGAAAIIEFKGTEVSLLARTTPWYGEAEIIHGGSVVDTVDLYSPSVGWKVLMYSDDSLSAGSAHYLVVKCKGTKNPSSWGVGISLDALDINGHLEQAETITRYQQDCAMFTYTGTWPTTNTNWYQASGASYVSTDETGAAVNVWFYGTYLSWVSRTTPWYGKAVVVVDGGEPQTVDLWSSSVKPKQKVFDTGLLGLDSHEVSIYYRGLKRWSSWGTRLNVDAFDILGFASGPADPASPIIFTQRYQQTDPKITYLGNWGYTSTWAASGGSYYSTDQAGAAAVIEFTGTDITVLGRTTPWYGYARVTLDGVEQSPEDLYSSSVLYKQPVVSKTGLTNDTHILTIECAGIKNPSSVGVAVCLDALDITGTLDQAQTTTRLQQDDGACEYTAGWSTTYTSWYYASGASYATTSSNTASMHIQFEGSSLTLISKKTPWYGKAMVYVDEGQPGAWWTVVDLWSPTQKYKQRVFNTGVLTPGTHDINIYCTGDKNPSSWGTAINVDAFDILVATP